MINSNVVFHHKHSHVFSSTITEQ